MSSANQNGYYSAISTKHVIFIVTFVKHYIVIILLCPLKQGYDTHAHTILAIGYTYSM